MVNTETTTPLAAAITAAGLKNQAELARRVGVSPSAVSFWLSGDRTPNGPARRQIAAVLGVSLDVVGKWFPANANHPAAAAGAR